MRMYSEHDKPSLLLWLFIGIAIVAIGGAVFFLGVTYQHVRENIGNISGEQNADTFSSDAVLPGASDITLAIGKTETIGGLSITLEEVTEDSRCPIDVVCMQAGGITMRTTLATKTNTETVTLSPEKFPKIFDAHRISVVNVDPVKMSGNEISPEDYRVTFHIE